ncbi:hypothetical protein M5K25_015307 [Dendrobium thyrsiflorum]|uniref:Uncharacterized protein n=1 Tax=Dendrobium thyrsiflorum TaxID=117978 RepID=A0ABD0UX13_DENTH
MSLSENYKQTSHSSLRGDPSKEEKKERNYNYLANSSTIVGLSLLFLWSIAWRKANNWGTLCCRFKKKRTFSTDGHRDAG